MAAFITTAVMTSDPTDVSTVSAMSLHLRDERYRIQISVTSDYGQTKFFIVSCNPLVRRSFGAIAKQFM
jgi:hypothetical protein